MVITESCALSNKEAVVPFKVPSHIAFIMDGNRRWAKNHHLGYEAGYWKGIETVNEVIRLCKNYGVQTVTLFSFSTENWNRLDEEVELLMNLFSYYLDTKTEELREKDIQVLSIGELSKLPEKLKQSIANAKERTKHCESLKLVLALNYGSRDEITRAVKGIVNDIDKGVISKQDLTEKLISSYLDTSGLKDPDLLIRTSGESRLSNFLLWQLCYTEVYITQTAWPDFNEQELLKAIKTYQKRDRRFGK